MSYRLYASDKTYVLLMKHNDLSKICIRIERELKHKDFNKYLLIENKDNTDFPIGLFFDEDGYNEFKQEHIKKYEKSNSIK